MSKLGSGLNLICCGGDKWHRMSGGVAVRMSEGTLRAEGWYRSETAGGGKSLVYPKVSLTAEAA